MNRIKSDSQIINVVLLTVLTTQILLFSGCATAHYNTYQDGKSIGRKNAEIYVGLSMGPLHEIKKIGELPEDQKLEYKIHSKVAPLVSMNGRGGLTDQLDFGISVGLSGEYFHGLLYGKLCLLNQESNLGLAIIPAAGFGGNSDEENDDQEDFKKEDIGYFLVKLSTPISYSINDKLTLAASPFIQQQKFKAKYTWMDNTTFKDSFTLSSRGVVIGIKYRPFPELNDGYIFPEVALVSNSMDGRIFPYFGICIGGTEWYRD